MEVQTKNAVGVEEIVIESGGNGGRIITEEKAPKYERIVFAKGSQPPPLELMERYDSLLDAYTIKFEELMDMNVNKAAELAGQGSQAELGEPITFNLFGRYKWWDLFVLGPIQNPFTTSRPNKIVAGGEWVHFFIFVVTNPLNISGPPPSAMGVMGGWQYKLRLETINLTNVVAGPVVNPPPWIFPGTFPVQLFLYSFLAPTPAQGQQQLLEVNVTADVIGPNPNKRFAAFATHLVDLDSDPGFPLPVPASGPHLHVEQPLRCLIYAK
jgi:hypothetical protein